MTSRQAAQGRDEDRVAAFAQDDRISFLFIGEAKHYGQYGPPMYADSSIIKAIENFSSYNLYEIPYQTPFNC